MIETIIDRSRDWWIGRSGRERTMLAVMFTLLGFLILWGGVIRPINAARSSAELRFAAATDDAGRIAATAGSLKRAQASAPPALSAALPVIINQAAETSGFTLSRLDPQGDDRATIAISTARSPALFAWLAALERQGIIVDKLTLRTNSDATLAVEGVVRTRGR